jgi:hypothetical protein
MAKVLKTLSLAFSVLLPVIGFGVLSRASFAESNAAQPAVEQPFQEEPAAATPAKPGPKLLPTPGEALKCGVLIVVSIPSQRLFVFKDGGVWGSTPVSTGRPGHGTPTGTFSILQKQVHHRSTLYSGAPMPYMQRLTWGGVALHAGHVTGRPASHGCIRLPWDFARKLYGVTNPASTAVMVVGRPLEYAEQARNLVGPGPARPPAVEQAYAAPPPALPPAAASLPYGRVETIQLAAASTAQSADTFWQELSQREPELQALNPVIIPATIRSVQVYRLRASGSEAFQLCNRLVATGTACMKVNSQ